MRNTGPGLQVYIIAGSPDGPCKIGHAKNPQARLGQLQVGNHLELKIYSVWASDSISPVEIERRVHAVFNDRWIRGEWFSVSVSEADSLIRILDDRQAFETSDDMAAILLKAMAHHPRYKE